MLLGGQGAVENAVLESKTGLWQVLAARATCDESTRVPAAGWWELVLDSDCNSLIPSPAVAAAVAPPACRPSLTSE